MTNKCPERDSLAEKTVGELNEKQKDELIKSFIYALKKLSEGGKIFLAVAGASLLGASLAITYYFLQK